MISPLRLPGHWLTAGLTTYVLIRKVFQGVEGAGPRAAGPKNFPDKSAARGGSPPAGALADCWTDLSLKFLRGPKTLMISPLRGGGSPPAGAPADCLTAGLTYH